MYRSQLVLLFLLCIVIFTNCTEDSIKLSDNLEIEGIRFKDPVFSDFIKHQDIPYDFSNPEWLLFDFYEPKGDIATQRPLIIMVAGGEFITVEKEKMEPLAEFFVKRGYTVANIKNYRTHGDVSSPISTTVFYENMMRSIFDLKSALKYFHQNETSHGIDKDKIYLLGHSAGAIAALGTTYINDIEQLPLELRTFVNKNGGLDDITPRGVISLSGAMMDVNQISYRSPLLISVHGTNDNVIPYENGFIQFEGMEEAVYMQGSSIITDRANSVGGIRPTLFSIDGGNHDSPLNNTDCWQKIVEALIQLL